MLHFLDDLRADLAYGFRWLRRSRGFAAAAILSLAAAAARGVSHMLFGLAPFDPVAFFAGSSIRLCVASLAAYVPARQASRMDPMVAMRQE